MKGLMICEFSASFQRYRKSVYISLVHNDWNILEDSTKLYTN